MVTPEDVAAYGELAPDITATVGGPLTPAGSAYTLGVRAVVLPGPRHVVDGGETTTEQ